MNRNEEKEKALVEMVYSNIESFRDGNIPAFIIIIRFGLKRRTISRLDGDETRIVCN